MPQEHELKSYYQKKKKNSYEEEIERMKSDICAMLAKILKEKQKITSTKF